MRGTMLGVGLGVFVLLVGVARGAEDPRGTDAQLFSTKIRELRPTQMAVGMIEVDEKADKLHHLANHPDELKDFLASNPEPVVLGPGKERYIIDHHHLALALDR